MNASTHFRMRDNRPTIGLLLQAFSDDYQADIWAGARDAAHEQEVNLICFTGGSITYRSTEDFEYQRNVLYKLIGPECVDGLVIEPNINPVSNEVLQKLCERYSPLPAVVIRRVLEGIPRVMVDYYQSTRIRLDHLLEMHGYRRIALCGTTSLLFC